MGSAFPDSTNHGWEIFGEKNSRNFQKAKLEIAIYIAFILLLHIGVTSNLEMI